jgi:hypothetical protein
MIFNLHTFANPSSNNAGPKADHPVAYVYALIHTKPWFDGFFQKN